MKTISLFLIIAVPLLVTVLIMTACSPEISVKDSTASENLEKSKDERLISRYDIQDHCGFLAARVDVRHIVELNGCDFIVASVAARSAGASVSIIHSPTCKCQKK